MLPSDAQAWLNLAMNLEQSGVTAVAETAYQNRENQKNSSRHPHICPAPDANNIFEPVKNASNPLNFSWIGLGSPICYCWNPVNMSCSVNLPQPDSIREFYSVKPHRIEPVGLVYLWPS